MSDIVKNHLSVIIAATLLGIVAGYFAFKAIYDGIGGMDEVLFSGLVFGVPCAIMFIASFIVAVTAQEIGRPLYIVMLGICLVTGVVSMLVASNWMSDSTIAATLTANSKEGAVIVPILKSPITILRNIAAYVVVPTVGLILGAWVGSRIHPLRGEKPKNNKSKKRK